MADTQENQGEPSPNESTRAGKKLERATKRQERETRAKRIILIGSLASFLGFFGLSVAAQPFTATQATNSPAPAMVASSHHDDDEHEARALFINGAQIRTRTS
jgi:hypothetical protein